MIFKIAKWSCLIAGLLGLIVGLRDTLAPGFFTISPRVMTKLDITLEFAVAATFLIAAGVFHISKRQLGGIKNK